REIEKGIRGFWRLNPSTLPSTSAIQSQTTSGIQRCHGSGLTRINSSFGAWWRPCLLRLKEFMACYRISHQNVHACWRTLYSSWKPNGLVSKSFFCKLSSLGCSTRKYCSSIPCKRDFRGGRNSLNSGVCSVVRPFSSTAISTSAQTAEAIDESTILNSATSDDVQTTMTPSNGRVMLIDGTSIIYRAYYKLLARLHHGHLSHADGNGDWVLTIFRALSL
ncbi:5-3 exonuclease family protein, partial [Striga hermonthica]